MSVNFCMQLKKVLFSKTFTFGDCFPSFTLLKSESMIVSTAFSKLLYC